MKEEKSRITELEVELKKCKEDFEYRGKVIDELRDKTIGGAADWVCTIILHNGYASHCNENVKDFTIYFHDNVLGRALMKWWLARHPDGVAKLQNKGGQK